MSRSEIHTRFATSFSFPRLKPAPSVSVHDLRAVEEELQTTFPATFVSFLLAHGPIFTPDILDLVVEAQEAGIHRHEGFDVREFLSPTEIVKDYRLYVSGGMDPSLVPIAVDSGGNAFGFRRELSTVRPDDSPVLVFDHDYCKIRDEAQSFDSWLEAFLRLKT